MMAHFADFTGKLSYGMYKSPENHFNLAWSADHTGGLRHQVYVAGRFVLEDGRGVRRRRQRRWRRVLHGAALEHLGHDPRHPRPDRQPQQGAVACPTRTAPTPTSISGADPGVHNWIDTGGLPEGILTLRMAEFPEGGARPDLSARGRVVAARPARRGGARAARGDARRSGPRSSPTGAPAYLRRRPQESDRMSRWLITGCSTGIGREIARAALEAGHQVVVTVPQGRRRRGPRRRAPGHRGRRGAGRHRQGADRGGGRGRRRGVRRHRRPGQQRRLRLPLRGRGGRRRRGARALRHQLLRHRRHDQGRAAAAARAGERPRRQHLLDDRAGRQPAERLLLLDQVRDGGADRGPGQGGRAARHQGHRDRARRVPHRLGQAVDARVGHADRRLRRRRRRPQGADQGVRRPPARRPAQGGRGGPDGGRSRGPAAPAAARRGRPPGRPREVRRDARVHRRVGVRDPRRELPARPS